MTVARTMRTRIKICGITTLEAAHAAVDAGADALGFVFAADSPRAIEVDCALEIIAALPPLVTTFAVYRKATRESFTQSGGAHLLFNVLQLHGNEEESLIEELNHDCVMRGFAFDPRAVKRWDASQGVSALLIDAHEPGSGKPFDHASLAEIMPRITKPVFLAGGLTPENVGHAIDLIRPYAVDVSSGVESSPGVKDPQTIHAFCAAVRAADMAAHKSTDQQLNRST